jgi:hypothetical protein
MTEMRMDKNDIVVGKPLPFSIYGADRMLLLAKGQRVESERVREALIRNGVLHNGNPTGPGGNPKGGAPAQEEERTKLSPLAVLRHDYQNLGSRSRFGLRMSREDGGESYLCWVVGYADRRGLILTAPTREDRTFVSVTEGQTWLFRTFYAMAAFRFNAVVQKVLFDPFPYLHIQLPQMIDMRLVRKTQRAQVCVNATVSGAQDMQAVVVDMSVSGLRLALVENCTLAKDQTVALSFTVTLLDKQHTLKMNGRVMSCYGNSDMKHPGVSFYGLNVEPAGELDQLVLHGFVQQHLVSELDSMWQALAIEGKSSSVV